MTNPNNVPELCECGHEETDHLDKAQDSACLCNVGVGMWARPCACEGFKPRDEYWYADRAEGRRRRSALGRERGAMSGAFDHTPTPWEVGDRNEYGDRYIMPVGGSNYLAFAAFGALGEWPSEANARRVVAAINATADVPIAILETMGPMAQERYEKRRSEASGA